MKSTTLDASVLVSAVSPKDVNFAQSRALLEELAQQGLSIVEPAFARVEVACALARKFKDSLGARTATHELFALFDVVEVGVDQTLLEAASGIGTQCFLRGADAIYAATAKLHDAQLISWNGEHIERGGALSPDAWLLQNRERNEKPGGAGS